MDLNGCGISERIGEDGRENAAGEEVEWCDSEKKIADEANWKIKLQRRLCRVMTKAASLNFPLIKTFESESKEKKERIFYAVLLTSQQKTSALAQP